MKQPVIGVTLSAVQLRVVHLQSAKFLVVGVAAVIIDGVVFFCLNHFSANSMLSKGCGFLGGALFAFILNQNWVFQKKYKFGSLIKFSTLYLCTLFVNVSAYQLAVLLLIKSQYAVQLAFFFATAISAGSNFLGMKYWAFRYD